MRRRGSWRALVPTPVASGVLVLLVGLAPAVVGCRSSTDPGVGLAPTTGAPTATGPAAAALWLSFDEPTTGYDGSTAYADARGGPLAGRVVTGSRGGVRRVAGPPGRGSALAFPPRCAASTGCPRAMVEVPPSPLLDAGTGALRFGATVRLAPGQTTAGSNIVQKGRYGTAGGQWKLQVDSDEGFPSCMVRTAEEVLTVRSRVSVSDASWHRVSCRRDADGLVIEVDGTADRRAGGAGSVDNDEPVRIGSPGVGDDDDQFHGSIDDVFVRVGG